MKFSQKLTPSVLVFKLFLVFVFFKDLFGKEPPFSKQMNFSEFEFLDHNFGGVSVEIDFFDVTGCFEESFPVVQNS